MTLQERARELTHAWVLCVIVIAGAARTDGGKGVGVARGERTYGGEGREVSF